MTHQHNWQPEEVILHRAVADNRVAQAFISRCPGVPVREVDSGDPSQVKAASRIVASCKGIRDRVLAGKRVVFLSPSVSNVVNPFAMPDHRIKCPHFDRLILASNGCFYRCEWCYLKVTYRDVFPFITVRVCYDDIKRTVERDLRRADGPKLYNNGEMQDSLAMEHLTQAGRTFIPWFGATDNGYLFMLTKSDNVDDITDLPHNGHTIITWSLNAPEVSSEFELGAPSFQRRLSAARRAQDVGYRVRVRLDPIVPLGDWRKRYAGTIRAIFEAISPERVTIGTLRFEENFWRQRKTTFTPGSRLPDELDRMVPMFEPMAIRGKKKPSVGKYSYPEDERYALFQFVTEEVRKHSDCDIALCKESNVVWDRLGLDISRCRCVCQYDGADMTDVASSM